MLRTPQFYVLYADVRHDGDGRPAGHGERRTDGAAWGIPAAALTLATSLNRVANGGSRIFWGWVSDRIGRETPWRSPSCCRRCASCWC